MADIFDVIADTTRRDLLQVLLDGSETTGSASREISVGEIVDRLGLSQPTVSKHLKVLRDAGVVSVREEGQRRFYRLDPAPLAGLEEWLAPFLTAAATLSPADDAGAAVFSAWSGGQLPAPLRRAAGVLQHPTEAGTTVGRAVADASHQARTALEDASAQVERRVIEPIRKRLGLGEPEGDE
jgi:ArsR family transcriptional regulator, arsenate/arsenite/antimonite-responsive transcriptional repressor